MKIIQLASQSLPKKSKNKKRCKVIGWNDHCKALYNEARDAFRAWNANDRIRYGDIFERMKLSRSKFREALRYCRNNENLIRRKKCLDLFLSSDKMNFWNEIKKSQPIKKISVIEGAGDSESIVTLFTRHFSKPFDYEYQLEDNIVCNTLSNSQTMNNLNTSKNINLNVDEAIKKLKKGTSHDGINTQHVKLSGPIFRKLLRIYFENILSHEYMLEPILHGEIRPIQKDSKCCKTKISNYIRTRCREISDLPYQATPNKGLKISDHPP